MADFVVSMLWVTGSPDEVDAFSRDVGLSSGEFNLGAIVPMPQGLEEVRSDSASETGYAALYGDWASVAGYWTFKESAADLGFPFPLQSREHVVACIKSFDCAEMYLAPARSIKRNLEQFGHASSESWMIEAWGTSGNADDVTVQALGDGVRVRFVTPNSAPLKISAALARRWPALSFRLLCCDEYKRYPKAFQLRDHRFVRDKSAAAEEVRSALFANG